MRWADLVLNYLQALAWPVVVIAAIWIFRAQLRKLILNVSKVSAFGAEAEFQELKGEVETAEKQISSLTDQTAATTAEEQADSTRVSETAEIAKAAEEKAQAQELSYVDFTDLDMADLTSAATEASKRLNSALTRVLQHFGVPLFMDSETTGKNLVRTTKYQDWPPIVRWINESMQSAAEMADISRKAKRADYGDISNQFDNTMRKLLSNIYETAGILRTAVEVSLRNTRED